MLVSNKTILAIAVSVALGQQAVADEVANTEESEVIEEIVVTGKSVTYANNNTSDEMLLQQSAMTSAMAVIDNLPGVLVNEGDTFGTDDWSTTVSIRGFQLSLDEQQVGITIDGVANGNSNYGGGAKANRYIDTENLQAVEVSQGTADVASRSNEALGGTLNFTTIDPTATEGLTASVSIGDFGAQKYFVRYNTGEIATDTMAWLSASSTSNSDWINGSAENKRDHLAAKFISSVGDIELTGYISYDDIHEDNYARITAGQFEANPEWDRLTDEWTGTPYVDQQYRRGWSTNRTNLLAYLEANAMFGDVEVTGNVYYHDNSGRGDWVPPYLVDVTNDTAGHSEVAGGTTVNGGESLGRIFYVDNAGNSLSPMAGCESSIMWPYGGAGAEYDPLCYGAGAIPVGSFRHSHYGKERIGFSADFIYDVTLAGIENVVRGGIWYENYERQEYRDWHKIIDSNVGHEFDHRPYWVQYDREYPVTTTMMYLEDTAEFGDLTARIGVKKFLVDLERNDLFENSSIDVNSDSDLLMSAGLVYNFQDTGFEMFAGYAENFAAIKDEILERDASALGQLNPETAENMDLGVRYAQGGLNASLTYYSIDFADRLTFISPDSAEGIDFLVGTNGSWVNTGGIESSGIEASVTYVLNDNWSAYASFTKNDSTYLSGSVDFPAGNTVFGSAEEMAVVSFDYAKEQYLAGLSTKYVGERWMDAANTQRIDAYTVSDFYMGVSLGNMGNISDIEMRLSINNLFDESYIGGVAGGWGGWIGAPRTAAFNLQATF